MDIVHNSEGIPSAMLCGYFILVNIFLWRCGGPSFDQSMIRLNAYCVCARMRRDRFYLLWRSFNGIHYARADNFIVGTYFIIYQKGTYLHNVVILMYRWWMEVTGNICNGCSTKWSREMLFYMSMLLWNFDVIWARHLRHIISIYHIISYITQFINQNDVLVIILVWNVLQRNWISLDSVNILTTNNNAS